MQGKGRGRGAPPTATERNLEVTSPGLSRKLHAAAPDPLALQRGRDLFLERERARAAARGGGGGWRQCISRAWRR